MDLRIDEEFAEKIPPLTREEYEQLEANILTDGCVINPLIIWNGVIVDGHNRYRILQDHPDIPYQVHEKEFSDRYEVIAWICKNQLGRRNLTPAQRKYLIGKQYEAEKARLGKEPGVSQSRGENGRFTVSGQNVPPRSADRTSERIAREIGTNERFVRRAEEFAKGIDAAEEVLPGIRQEIFSGDIHPPDKDIMALARASPEEREVLVERLRNPCSTSSEKTEQLDEAGEGQDDLSDKNETAKPFKPSLVSIQAISDRMASDSGVPRAVVDTEFIILELEDALGSMMFRWDTCLSDYRKEAAAKDCQKKIKELVLEGIRYLQQYKGGVRNEVI